MFRTLLLALPFALAATVSAADVTIHITGPGTMAKYIKEGDTEQKAVTVRVGHTVKWANDRQTNTTHTASYRRSGMSTGYILDTGIIGIGDSKDVVITRDLFERAGGAAGGKVELEYYCTRHMAGMKSKLIIDDTPIEKSVALAQARLIPRIVTVKLKIEGDPQSLEIEATGEVPTSGYSDANLVFAVYITPPEDGIQDLSLIAVAPTGQVAQVVSQVEAKATWKDFRKEAPWVKGVRVHGVGNGIVEKTLP